MDIQLDCHCVMCGNNRTGDELKNRVGPVIARPTQKSGLSFPKLGPFLLWANKAIRQNKTATGNHLAIC